MPSITTSVRGFTLVEAIAVIVVTGIIASVVAVFIAKPVEGYVDTVRRAALSDMADSALRQMGREVRSALPNSVRTQSSSSTSYLEFIPTRDGARYRVANGDSTDLQSPLAILGGGNLTFAAGDYAVVFNTNQCSTDTPPTPQCGRTVPCDGAQAYEGCNRRTIATGSTATSLILSPTAAFPFDSPAHRVHIVYSSGPVTYACEAPTAADTAAGLAGPMVLHRYTGYNTGANVWTGATLNANQQPTVFDGSKTLAAATAVPVADSISACAFTYQPGVTQRSGLITLSLTLTRSGESVTLYHEIHVDNQP